MIDHPVLKIHLVYHNPTISYLYSSSLTNNDFFKFNKSILKRKTDLIPPTNNYSYVELNRILTFLSIMSKKNQELSLLLREYF